MSRQAHSLDVLLAEVNAAAPTRSKASDGGLGDEAHSARASDHNPNDAGVWRARDFTNDPPRFSADDLAQFVAARLGQHPALGSGAYVIWERRIISADRLAEGWRPYSGANPHNKHVHVSVATAATGYDSLAPWGWGEDEMNAAQERKLDDALTNAKSARAQALAAHKVALEVREMVRQIGIASGADVDEAAIAQHVADEFARRMKE